MDTLSGITLAFMASVFWAVANGTQKSLLSQHSPLLIPTVIAVGQIPVMGLWLLWEGAPQPGQGFWWVTGLAALLNTAAILLYAMSLKLSPISATIPYLCLTMVFMLGTGWWILDEAPSLHGGAGVLLVAAGTLLLNLQWTEGRIAWKGLLRHRGSAPMIGVAALWSVTGCLDKLAVQQASPVFYVLMLHLGMSVPLVLAAALKWDGAYRAPWRRPELLALAVAMTAGAFVLQFASLEKTLAIYTMAIKRTDVLLSALLGFIWFREGGLRRRLPAAVLMAGGAALIALYG
jgi:drug/metabolite transporter (DMT)-like permease